MAKGHDGADKAKHPEGNKHPEGKSGDAKHPEGKSGDAKHAEAKHGEAKHGEAKHPEAPKSSKSKGHSPLPGGCFSWGCKAQAKQFNFCPEHYDHFKFGLIKKTGEPVSDYEKKFEHYMAHKAKKSVPRVA